MERIGFGLRFFAAVLDCIIVMVIIFVFAMITGLGLAAMSRPEVGGIWATLGVLIVLAYLSLEIFKAATPGKMIMKLRIRNADGTPAPVETLAKRWAVKNAGSLLRFLGALTTMALFGQLGMLIGFVIFLGCFMVFGADRQALHDKVAHTAVYKSA